MTVLLHLRNSTPGLAPAADNLQQGQLAINTADATLWTINSSGVVKKIGDSSILAASPTGTAGLTAVAGSSITYMRSDAAPAISQAIAPTWTAQHTFNLRPTFNGNIPYDTGNLNIANYLALTGGTLSGQLLFSGAAGSNTRQIRYETAGVLRWIEGVDIEAESGSNAGANWTLTSYSDSGSPVATAMTANRATGVVAFGSIPTSPTPTAGDSSTNVATTAFVQQTKIANAARTSTVQATTVGVNDRYVGINYAGASTLSLPGTSWTQGQMVTIKDESGKAGTNNITITTGGPLIDGQSSVVLALNRGSITLLWNTSFWSII